MAGAVRGVRARGVCLCWANVATAVSCQLCRLPQLPQLPHASNSAWAWAYCSMSKTSSVSIANAPRAAMFANWMETPTKKTTYNIQLCVCVCVLNNVTVQLTITITRRNNNKHTTRCIVGWKAITHVLAIYTGTAHHPLPRTHTHTHPSLQKHPHTLPPRSSPFTHTSYFLISANVWTLFSHIFICLASHKMCVNIKRPPFPRAHSPSILKFNTLCGEAEYPQCTHTHTQLHKYMGNCQNVCTASLAFNLIQKLPYPLSPLSPFHCLPLLEIGNRARSNNNRKSNN